MSDTFNEEFERNMKELVERGLMRATGPGTYAITDAGEAYVDGMNRPPERMLEVVRAQDTKENTNGALVELNTKIDEANEQRRALIKAAKATLLFHSGGPWSDARAEEWRELTGFDEATTHTLCDFVRAQLGKAGEL